MCISTKVLTPTKEGLSHPCDPSRNSNLMPYFSFKNRCCHTPFPLEYPFTFHKGGMNISQNYTIAQHPQPLVTTIVCIVGGVL